MARRKKKGGRPGTGSWTAILNYSIADENGEFTKWNQLKKNDEDGNMTMYFDNHEEAVSTLEDRQIEGNIMYKIFIQYKDTDFIMKPAKISRIEYDHTEFEYDEDDETPEEDITKEIPDGEGTIDDLSNLDDDE